MMDFNLSEFMTQSKESLMEKMPCRITDEVISNDPQDAPEATYQDYTVTLPVTGHITITCNEANNSLRYRQSQRVGYFRA